MFNVLLRSTAVDVSGEIYYANQLSFKIQSELNAAFNDIVPDLFLTVYGQSELLIVACTVYLSLLVTLGCVEHQTCTLHVTTCTVVVSLVVNS